MEGKYIFRQSRHTIFFIIQRSEFKIRAQFEHSAYVFLRNNIILVSVIIQTEQMVNKQ